MSGEQKPKSHSFSQISNLSLFTSLELLKRGKPFARKKQVQLSQTYTENLLSLYAAIYLSHWTGERQMSRPFRHCWKWTRTNRQKNLGSQSITFVHQSEWRLVWINERDFDPFNFMDNLLVSSNHYLAILQILSV